MPTNFLIQLLENRSVIAWPVCRSEVLGFPEGMVALWAQKETVAHQFPRHVSPSASYYLHCNNLQMSNYSVCS